MNPRDIFARRKVFAFHMYWYILFLRILQMHVQVINVDFQVFKSNLEDYFMRNSHVNIPLTSLPDFEEIKEDQWRGYSKNVHAMTRDQLDQVEGKYMTAENRHASTLEIVQIKMLSSKMKNCVYRWK